MAETLFGPWHIALDLTAFLVGRQSFVIAGSDDADGRFEAFPKTPLDVTVHGAEWQISMEAFDDDVGWQPRPIRKEMIFQPQVGLQATLDSDLIIDDLLFPGMELICTSLDPETNPIPTPNPFDFTIPD